MFNSNRSDTRSWKADAVIVFLTNHRPR